MGGFIGVLGEHSPGFAVGFTRFVERFIRGFIGVYRGFVRVYKAYRSWL